MNDFNEELFSEVNELRTVDLPPTAPAVYTDEYLPVLFNNGAKTTTSSTTGISGCINLPWQDANTTFKMGTVADFNDDSDNFYFSKPNSQFGIVENITDWLIIQVTNGSDNNNTQIPFNVLANGHALGMRNAHTEDNKIYGKGGAGHKLMINPKNSNLPKKYIDDIFKNFYGTTLNLNELQDRIKLIKKWYEDKGYSLARVNGPERISGEGVISLSIDEGIITDIELRFLGADGESSVDGKPRKGKTKDWVIKRELKTIPGLSLIHI